MRALLLVLLFVLSDCFSADVVVIERVVNGAVTEDRPVSVPRVSCVTVQADRTTATLSNIAGLRANVKEGRTYSFRATLFYDANVTGGHKYAIGGTCTATSIIYNIDSNSNSSNLNVINSRHAALGGATGQAGSTSGKTEITGTITVATGGNLTVQFAQNAQSGTSSILVGSNFIVDDMH